MTLTQNINRLPLKFWHFGYKKIFDVKGLLCEDLWENKLWYVVLDTPCKDKKITKDITFSNRLVKNILTRWIIDEDGILLHSTGLKDVNENLLYEGDIVEAYDKAHCERKKYICNYGVFTAFEDSKFPEPNTYSFYLNEGEKNFPIYNVAGYACINNHVGLKNIHEDLNYYGIKIIGNIYETPKIINI